MATLTATSPGAASCSSSDDPVSGRNRAHVLAAGEPLLAAAQQATGPRRPHGAGAPEGEGAGGKSLQRAQRMPGCVSTDLATDLDAGFDREAEVEACEDSRLGVLQFGVGERVPASLRS